MKKTFLISLLILTPFFIFSEDSVPAASAGEKASEELSFLASHLGLSLAEAVEKEGLPAEMYSLRGPSAGQDSVVFYYSDRISLYWTESHVWQVRIDSGYSSDEDVLKMGMTRSEISSLLGAPDLEETDFVIYTLPQRVYPVAAAFYFDNNRLKDLYVYRSDF